MSARLTILCLASYHKGIELLRELRRQDCTVLLVTSKSLEDAEWPRDSIDEIFYMPDVDKQWDARDTLLGISHLARSRRIDRIVPLDDFDLEKAAAVREHLRVPGMGESQTRFFRDKLAMRGRASQSGIPVPVFVPLVNDEQVREFMGRVPPPWIQAAQSRRSLEHGRRPRRPAVVLPARAVCPGRHLPRRLGCVERRRRSSGRQPVRYAAVYRLARWGRVQNAPGRAWLDRRSGTAVSQRRRVVGVRPP